MIIGFDLDGVIAKRPRIFKLNNPKGKYRINLAYWEQWFWRIVMWVREPSKQMVNKVKTLKDQGDKVLLISGRLSFLEDMTLWWLGRYGLTKYFDQIIVNVDNLQPHEFKEREIKRRKVEEFYEDEIFAAEYLKQHTKARINLVVANGEIIKRL